MLRKAVKLGICCLVLLALILRIDIVNQHASVLPESISKVGERVDLDGSFSGQSIEQTEGLGVVVVRAEMMSKEEYLGRYVDRDKSYEEPSSEHWENGKNLVCVTVRLSNRDNSSGYFALLNWRLISPDGTDAYMMNSDLMMASEPLFKSSGSAGYAKLNPGRTYELHIPFCRQEKVILGGLSDYVFKSVPKGRYRLLLTNYPHRKMVEMYMQ